MHRKTGRRRTRRPKNRNRYTKKRGGQGCTNDTLFKRFMDNPHPR